MIAVLDTNILLTDPDLTNYKNQFVYIPISVYKELDRQKGLDGVVGFKARAVNRRIKDSIEGEGYIKYNDSDVTILLPTPELEARINPLLSEEKADDSFLNMQIFAKDKEYILHTADFSLYQLMKINDKNTLFIKDLGKAFLENIYSGYSTVEDGDTTGFFNENEYVLIKTVEGDKLTRHTKGSFKPVKTKKLYGIGPKNLKQTMLVDALIDKDIKIIIVTGNAGTGKTLLSLAGGLQQVENTDYDSIILAKSLAPLSKDDQVGFLPGELYEKLIPQFRNFTSNLEFLCGGKHKFRKDNKNVITNTGSQILEHMMNRGDVEIMALDSVLGASLDKKFVVVDEAQSLDIDSLGCLLTRITDNSKLILVGDVLQRTSVMKSPDRSALFLANKYLKNTEGVAIISLSKVERGKICNIVQEKLKEVGL